MRLLIYLRSHQREYCHGEVSLICWKTRTHLQEKKKEKRIKMCFYHLKCQTVKNEETISCRVQHTSRLCHDKNIQKSIYIFFSAGVQPFQGQTTQRWSLLASSSPRFRHLTATFHTTVCDFIWTIKHFFPLPTIHHLSQEVSGCCWRTWEVSSLHSIHPANKKAFKFVYLYKI